MVDETRRLIRVRRKQRTPKFQRTQLHHKKKLKDTWRRPRGLHNKQRRHYRAKGAHPQPGYGAPASVRGYHPSGFVEVLVHTPGDLEALDPATQAIRIGGTVGGRKRAVIQARALELGLKILNPRDVAIPAVDETGMEEDDD